MKKIARRVFLASVLLCITAFLLYLFVIFDLPVGLSSTDGCFRSSKKKERLTVIVVWNGSKFQEYQRHFIHSAQENKDTLDVILLNREDSSGCLNLEAHGVVLNKTGNIAVYCFSPSEWLARHTAFFCNSQDGWNCSIEEESMVKEKLQTCIDSDRKNGSFRLFLAYIFEDIITNVTTSTFWAWMDMDTSLGDMTTFPFEMLSTVSFLTFSSGHYQFLHGQMTAFNLAHQDLRNAWKIEEEFRNPRRFIESPLKKFGEEKYWSRAYLRSEPNRAGSKLSWAFVPFDVAGDTELQRDGKAAYAISGREIVFYNELESYDQLENDFRSIREKKRRANNFALVYGREKHGNEHQSSFWEGIYHDDENVVETILTFNTGKVCKPRFWLPPEYAQCLSKHPYEMLQPPQFQTMYLREKSNNAGLVFRQLRKIRPQESGSLRQPAMLHYLHLKRKFLFPSFPIEDDLIMIITKDKLVVIEHRTRIIKFYSDKFELK